ncbi:MAG: preprotein translocase subunit SecY [Defluviitaleaceae bacterium]|nr:preprotein translocase subunit SecY [Defluviitaleaceae bacterium]
MFSVFVNAWKVKDIRNKLLYVLAVLAIYRLGCHIPLPGMDLQSLSLARGGAMGGAPTLFSLIAGGGFGTIFALGIAPYITASIIMQLMTAAIPKLEQLQKEGEDGRKKINQITRILAIVLGVLQGGGTVYSMHGLFKYQNWLVYIMATVAIVAGVSLIMWVAELLTEKGIGNGASFIIFANILSGLGGAIYTFTIFLTNATFWTYAMFLGLAIAFVLIMAFVVLVQDGERRIPVQYSKKMVGRQMFGGQSSYIPIKVNIAGVMSIIFAISFLQVPEVLSQFWSPPWIRTLANFLDINSPFVFNIAGNFIAIPTGAIIYVFLIFCFTFFYTSFAVNPVEMAENMKKNGGAIPGVRTGKPTSEYIQTVIKRMSWIGAVFYSAIAVTPILMQWLFGIPVGFGGTTLLIVTGVALELVKQIESQLLMRHYKGFLS